MNTIHYDLSFTVIEKKNENNVEEEQDKIDISDWFWVEKKEVSHKSFQAFYA